MPCCLVAKLPASLCATHLSHLSAHPPSLLAYFPRISFAPHKNMRLLRLLTWQPQERGHPATPPSTRGRRTAMGGVPPRDCWMTCSKNLFARLELGAYYSDGVRRDFPVKGVIYLTVVQRRGVVVLRPAGHRKEPKTPWIDCAKCFLF